MPLPPDRQKQLEDLIVQLDASGASKEDLQTVIDEFSTKYAGASATPQEHRPIQGRGTGYDPANVPGNQAMLKSFGAKALPVAAGLALGPVTGGMSALPAMATMGAGAGAASVAGNMLEGKPIDTKGAGMEALINGLTEGTFRGVTAGYKAIAPALESGGKTLYASVLKPLTATLEGVGNRWGSADDLLARARNISGSLMDEGYNVSGKAMPKILAKLRASEDAAKATIADSTAMASTAPAQANLASGAEQALFKSEATQKAWAKQAREMGRNPLLSEEVLADVPVESPILGPDGKPYMSTEKQVVGRRVKDEVPVQILQGRKQGLTADVGDEAFGRLSGGQKQAMKAEAAGDRQAVDTVVPEIRPINERTGQLIDQRDVMGDATKRVGNTNPLSLDTLVIASHILHNPLVAAGLVNRPAIGSPVARLLYNAGKAAPGVENSSLGMLYRTALLGHLMGNLDQDGQPQPPSQ